MLFDVEREVWSPETQRLCLCLLGAKKFKARKTQQRHKQMLTQQLYVSCSSTHAMFQLKDQCTKYSVQNWCFEWGGVAKLKQLQLVDWWNWHQQHQHNLCYFYCSPEEEESLSHQENTGCCMNNKSCFTSAATDDKSQCISCSKCNFPDEAGWIFPLMLMFIWMYSVLFV